MQAIKAGVIGGVILAACMLVTLLIDIINSNTYVGLTGLGLVGCCVFILEIIVLLGTGALAVQMAKSLVVKLDEAAVVGAIAGALAGLIGTVMQVIVAIVRPWVTNVSSYSDVYNYSQYGVGSSALSMFTGVVGAVICCGPMLIIAGAIIAAIGGAIYAVAVLKVK
ncbi:MAG TPA: hypothetical protein VGK13_02140 [Methanocellaceae archaeon]